MSEFLHRTRRRQLVRQHKSERDKRICDRIKAVLMHDDGYSNTEIAKVLLIDDETVRRHIVDYEREEKLHSANGGSESELDETQTQELISHIKESLYLHVHEIVLYVKARYDIAYTQSGMTKWLKRNGFRYKKPHRVPAKGDIAKQQEFIEHYQELKAQCEKTGDVIYFTDCVHPQHQTQIACGWIYRGEHKAVRTTGCQRRLNYVGAINLATQHLVIERIEDKTIIHSHIEHFLRTLRSHHPPNIRIHLFMDGAGYNKHDTVLLLAEQLNITIHGLPPYSPNLNPIERVWKLMHEYVRYNRYYEKFSEFTAAIDGFFKTIRRKKTILKHRVTDNFQLFDNVNFAS